MKALIRRLPVSCPKVVDILLGLRKVVDMFYFPIIDTNWPTWMPFVGGEHFIFFSPIFNFADAAISCGIIALLLFYSKYLNESYHSLDKDKKEATDHEK